MTTNSADGNGHKRTLRWPSLHRARGRISHRSGQVRTKLAQLWRHETVRHLAFSAAVTLLGAWLLGQLLPGMPGVAATVDAVGATIDDPVRRYLVAHTQELPITAGTTYSIWKALGLVAFVLGALHNGPARFTWMVWGAATVIMVLIETPGPGRPVATAVSLLAWAALSSLALRGLRLPPLAFVHVDVHNEASSPPDVQVRTEIRMPRTEPPQFLPYPLPYLPPSQN
ncbi:hypothetical protein AB0N17_42425 [Streptomyces sp. NPDC051133]|uniref:hypothetical protein n=1 Tax=Streptomyces sp. NPDC051133 TaxID=3155521 RepID=UPI00342E0084